MSYDGGGVIRARAFSKSHAAIQGRGYFYLSSDLFLCPHEAQRK